jgi:hypothetical protein
MNETTGANRIDVFCFCEMSHGIEAKKDICCRDRFTNLARFTFPNRIQFAH